MIILRCVLATALVITGGQKTSSQQAPSPTKPAPPASCPVTPRRKTAFIPPAPYQNQTELSEQVFLIGTESLWTYLSEPMVWAWAPHRPGHEQDLTQKVFWFRVGYSARNEPVPKLRVAGRRLDGPAPPLEHPQGIATNGILGEQVSSMLTGVYVPTPGCWEITGDYEGDKLSFVVWVEPAQPQSQ